MSSKPATEQRALQHDTASHAPAIQTFDDLWRTISRRAYELFDMRGRQEGHDLCDWLLAESEMSSVVPIEVAERDNQLIVRAEVPGFKKEELSIHVDGARMQITGKSHSTKEEKGENTVYSERRASEVFRAINLPSEVAANTASATLNNGVLEITLNKAKTASPPGVEVKIK